MHCTAPFLLGNEPANIVIAIVNKSINHVFGVSYIINVSNYFVRIFTLSHEVKRE